MWRVVWRVMVVAIVAVSAAILAMFVAERLSPKRPVPPHEALPMAPATKHQPAKPELP